MTQSPRISFEFFPPQTLDASFRLWETVQALAPMGPVPPPRQPGGCSRAMSASQSAPRSAWAVSAG